MDFTLTEEQELLRDSARALLSAECPPALVRAHMEEPAVVQPLWARHLSGWAALGDGPLVDLCLFLEEMGAVVAPGVFFPTAVLALPLLRAVGHPLADELAAGSTTATVALAGRDGIWRPSDDHVRTFVPEADRVDHVVLVAPGPSLAVVPTPALIEGMRRVETLDSTRRLFELDASPALNDGEPVAPDVIDAWLARATVALAAEMLGSVRWMVDTAVAYAKERVQFDKPIGSFQGLQWKLVDMSLDHQRAAAAVYYAAMTIDAADADRHRAVHVAKAAVGVAAKHCAKGSMQTLGGIGYTWEHDEHLYLRRVYASEYLLGPSSWHHDRLADLLLG